MKTKGRHERVIDVQRVLVLRRQGVSLRVIAQRMGVGHETVRRRLKELQACEMASVQDLADAFSGVPQ